MRFFSFSILISLFLIQCPISFSVVIESSETLKISKSFRTWDTNYRNNLEEHKKKLDFNTEDFFTECFLVEEIQQTFICISDTKVSMNLKLARASIFLEGNNNLSKGTVIQNQDPQFLDVVNGPHALAGLDLRSLDLQIYWHTMMNKCQEDSHFCPDAEEKNIFESFILPKIKKIGNFSIITYALNSKLGADKIVSHEIMHAQFFQNQGYMKVVENFWKNISPETKEKIKNTLAPYYDRSDDFLMMNEFQAYILMAKAEESDLSEFVTELRPLLTKKFKNSGVNIIQFEW